MSSMNSNPRISIVMPMYGVELYIEKAIQSVLNQDFQDWELLIVNDGSKDKSREIAYRVAYGDNRIKILDKENGGLSDARNYGLDRATGEFVHFYDSDDWIEPDFYSKLFNEIEDFDLVVCGYKVDNGKTVTERIGYVGELSQVVDSSLENLVGNYLNFAWNKLFKRSFLVKNTLYYEKGLYRIEDSEFMMRFLSCAPRVKLIKYSGYHYMVRNTATLSKFFDKNIFNHLSRCISIRAHIYKQLCDNVEIVNRELGEATLSQVKSAICLIVNSIAFYNIKGGKIFINRILEDVDICKYVSYSSPTRFRDKLIVNAIVNKRWGVLLFVGLLNKISKKH